MYAWHVRFQNCFVIVIVCCHFFFSACELGDQLRKWLDRVEASFLNYPPVQATATPGETRLSPYLLRL